MTSLQLQKSMLDLNLERDYISNLPTEVKEHVLLQLPIKEAIQTSLLSTKWKYAWMSIPNLVFKEDCETSKLIKLVDMVLLMHHGPILHFKLSCKKACNEPIGRWMLILSRNGIKNLYVNMTLYRHAEKCLVPSSFFLCLKLEHVELYNSIIHVPQIFQGFEFLHTLKLLEFNITGITLSKFISCCTLLVTLELSSFIEEGYLIIHAPNLTWLRINGEFGGLCLEAPKLLFADIYRCNRISVSDYKDHECNILRVLGSLFAIEELEISCNIVNTGAIPEDLPVSFYHLKELCIVDLFSMNKVDAEFAFCLFRGAPNLKVLSLELWYDGIDNLSLLNQTLWDAKGMESNLFQCLEIVKVTFFQGPEALLDVAKFVLSTAPVLEKLAIDSYYVDILVDGMLFLKKLLSFPRVSKMAQIVFVE